MIVNSKVPTGTPILGLNYNALEFCNFTYMCIKEPFGDIRIPENLLGVVKPVVREVMASGSVLAEDYLYISVKKSHVQPYTTAMRSGFHIDGFLSNDRNWILADSMPTQVAVGTFSITPDHEKSLIEMYEQSRHKDRVQLKPHTLYHLDHECVHAPVNNMRGETVVRTFIKVVASKELFNGYGNAWNYLLPHIKPTAKRGATRNHTVV